jgi:hypothetical protein
MIVVNKKTGKERIMTQKELLEFSIKRKSR